MDRSPAIAAFHTWAREAPYNDVFVYHRDGVERDESVFEYARKLHDAGLAFLFQRRTRAGFERCARRTTPTHHFTLDKVSAAIQVAPSTMEDA